MAQAQAPVNALQDQRSWYQKLSRSSYFFLAVLLHLLLFAMLAAYVIFPAFKPPTDYFK
jgi:hypothetical protein